MGYILCPEHGGNVVSFASKYHVDKVYNNKKCLKSEVIEVDLIGEQGLFNDTYLADPNLFKKLFTRELIRCIETQFFYSKTHN